MPETLLFTDGSVSIQSGIGYGAYLKILDPKLSLKEYRKTIRTKRFESTSSTKLELQTLLWALSEVADEIDKVIIHTDSQTIISLLKRRDRLEKHDFRSKKGTLLNHHELYQQFFQRIDEIDCSFVKMKGHLRSKEKYSTDHLFSLVDKASRQALRNEIR